MLQLEVDEPQVLYLLPDYLFPHGVAITQVINRCLKLYSDGIASAERPGLIKYWPMLENLVCHLAVEHYRLLNGFNHEHSFLNIAVVLTLCFQQLAEKLDNKITENTFDINYFPVLTAAKVQRLTSVSGRSFDDSEVFRAFVMHMSNNVCAFYLGYSPQRARELGLPVDDEL